MSSSNDDLSAILIAVRNDVMKETQRKQVPWEHSALTGRFYFGSAPKTASPPPVAPVRVSEAAEAWDRTKDTTSVAALELFMVAYQNTYYAGLARLRIDSLREEEASRVGLAKREAELRKAEEAKRLAEAKQAEEQKRLEETKRSEELTKAREEARRAQEALPGCRSRTPRGAQGCGRSSQASGGSDVLGQNGQRTPEHRTPVFSPAGYRYKGIGPLAADRLKRVGCDPGQVDGNWTPKVKAALRDFARITKKSIPTDTPSEAALAVVSGQKSQVCNVRPVEKQPVERQRQAKERTQPQASPSSEPKSSGMECVGMIARDQAAAPWCKRVAQQSNRAKLVARSYSPQATSGRTVHGSFWPTTEVFGAAAFPSGMGGPTDVLRTWPRGP